MMTRFPSHPHMLPCNHLIVYIYIRKSWAPRLSGLRSQHLIPTHFAEVSFNLETSGKSCSMANVSTQPNSIYDFSHHNGMENEAPIRMNWKFNNNNNHKILVTHTYIQQSRRNNNNNRSAPYWGLRVGISMDFRPYSITSDTETRHTNVSLFTHPTNPPQWNYDYYCSLIYNNFLGLRRGVSISWCWLAVRHIWWIWCWLAG